MCVYGYVYIVYFYSSIIAFQFFFVNMNFLNNITAILRILIFFVASSSSLLSLASPDSAGIVEMIDGLAYGGIPYGSVSGMINKYHGSPIQPDTYELTRQIPLQQNQQYQGSTSPIIVTPNFRAPGLERRQRGPVQIYRLPGVIAPGVVGTFSQIGY